ncbi:MAG: NAD-binding protein [Haloferacaceae archaeon]
MHVIVVGYGRVGARTARVLEEEGHHVVVVDDDEEVARRARDRGFTVVVGDAADEAVLEQAGIDDADAIGGFTRNVDTNYAVCIIGTDHGCRTVMRITEDFSSGVYDRYAEAVDDVVYPERLGAAGAKTALLGGDFNAIADITEELQLTTVSVTPGAPIVGDHVNEIDLGDRGRIYAHGRDEEPMTIPLPGTIVEEGDRLALLADADALEEVRAALLG